MSPSPSVPILCPKVQKKNNTIDQPTMLFKNERNKKKSDLINKNKSISVIHVNVMIKRCKYNECICTMYKY